MIQSPDDVATYAERIRRGDSPRPAVLIFGIDPWWVKEGDTHEGWLEAVAPGGRVARCRAHPGGASAGAGAARLPLAGGADGGAEPLPGLPVSGDRGGGATPWRRLPYRRQPATRTSDGARLTGRIPRYKDRFQILQMVTEHRGFYTLPARVDPMRVTILLKRESGAAAAGDRSVCVPASLCERSANCLRDVSYLAVVLALVSPRAARTPTGRWPSLLASLCPTARWFR